MATVMNKLIRIADKSEGGWTTVDEYLSDEVASDSEDQKRIPLFPLLTPNVTTICIYSEVIVAH
jgi:hypothetical protein